MCQNCGAKKQPVVLSCYINNPTAPCHQCGAHGLGVECGPKTHTRSDVAEQVSQYEPTLNRGPLGEDSAPLNDDDDRRKKKPNNPYGARGLPKCHNCRRKKQSVALSC